MQNPRMQPKYFLSHITNSWGKNMVNEQVTVEENVSKLFQNPEGDMISSWIKKIIS